MIVPGRSNPRYARRAWTFYFTFASLVLIANRAEASPNIVPPRQRNVTEAAYPSEGKGDARVLLLLVVDATGAVTDVTVREGVAPFADAAVAAAKTWTFSPATRDDEPIAARISAIVTFQAPRQAPPTPATTPTVEQPAAAVDGAAPSEPAPPIIEVAVKGEHEELGSIHIPRSETRFIPGAFGDPFRVVEALPGMAPWLSGLPYFYVRGSSPENVGYYIDGIRVPLLFHVGAGPSMIAPSLVDTVDLFPAAYPARYGHFAGAVIAGETTRPNETAAHADFDVRVFDASALAETPIDHGQGTVLAAARYGYTGPILALIDPGYSLAYWDYQARVTHRVFGTDQVSLFVFGAFDELKNLGSPTFRVQYHRADLRYDHPVREGNLRVAATLNFDDTLTALQTDSGAGAAAALKGAGARVRVEFDQHVTSDMWVRAGGDVAVTRFTVDTYDDVAQAPHTDVVGGLYADVVWHPSERVEIVPGARVDVYRSRNETTWAPQPRLSARIKLSRDVSAISAAGVAHQEPTDEVFVPAKLPDPIDEVSRQSYQYSEAVETRLPWGFSARVTGFYTELVAPRVDGKEQNAGIELFLRRAFTQRLAGFVSYTLSRSETTLNSITMRSSGDSTHLLSAVVGYDLGTNWRVGTRLFFRSGRPFDVTCPPGPGCTPAQSTQVHSGQLPPFFRVDVRLEKKWLFANGKWLGFTLECFNALDEGEVTSENFSPTQGFYPNKQNPILLPSVGLGGGF
jgi:TonB family protein